MKHRNPCSGLVRSLAVAAVAGVLLCWALPVSVQALPAVQVAGAIVGSSCSLPDGSPDGVIGSDGNTCCPVNHQSPEDCLYAKYINPAIALLSAVVGIAITIAIVYGAIEYITSGGDPQRIAAGKKRITEALIGLVAFILLYAFIRFLIPGTGF